jgi:Ca2+-binding EF-hand superfamily protein
MSGTWTKSQYAEIRDAFRYFDDDHDGTISGKQAETLIQALGLSPTLAELNAAKIFPQNKYSFSSIMNIMSTHFTKRRKNISSEIIAAFRYFNAFVNKCPSRVEDGIRYTDDNDEIGISDLEHIMTMMGDRLNATEWANLNAKAREFVVPATGRINYRMLVMSIV